MERQITSLEEYVKKQFPQAEYIVIKDIVSSFNEDRKGLKKLIELAGRIDVAVVAYKDRLMSFSILRTFQSL